MFESDERGIRLVSCCLRDLVGWWGSREVLFFRVSLRVFLVCWLGILRGFVLKWF